MKTYGGSEYIDPRILDRSALRPGRSTPGKELPGTHWIGGWIGPRAGLDDVERRKIVHLLGLKLRSLSHPAPIQSLH
jgi:hypothetical protein